MTISKLLLLLVLFFGSTMVSIHGSPSIKEYHPIAAREFSPPVEKKAPIKKRKKKRIKKRLKFKQKKQYRSPLQTTGNVFIPIMILVLLLLFLPIAFMIMGGILGGIGWIYAGIIISCLWLTLAYFLIFINYSPFPYIGLLISLFFILASVALLIWGLIAILPIINIVSIILGSIALIALVLFFIVLTR
ncbi:hypothetical protein [Aureispira anguillae]|uniref:Uncharacterized protein n=1 Tax=Aureispira anguillae TaxID=2864201 RepID=A0A916DUD9_9BACT|nr:hypothetical protein [Aureispira anguillae]BDS12445.1 hypothetical protein AsAng_0031680 [Aureispira anguillae]